MIGADMIVCIGLSALLMPYLVDPVVICMLRLRKRGVLLSSGARPSCRVSIVSGALPPLSWNLERSFGHDIFSKLPPPGNGRQTHGHPHTPDVSNDGRTDLTVIDVTPRVDLETLDDFTISGNFLIVNQYLTRPTGRILSLADHLPSQAIRPEHEASIEIPDELLHTLTMLSHGVLRSMPLRPLPDLPWHEETRRQLDQTPTSLICGGLTHISLYTDGSAGQRYADYTYYDHAAWSFVVIGWHEDNQEATKVILTMDCGHVSGTTAECDWTGASKLNAMALRLLGCFVRDFVVMLPSILIPLRQASQLPAYGTLLLGPMMQLYSVLFFRSSFNNKNCQYTLNMYEHILVNHGMNVLTHWLTGRGPLTGPIQYWTLMSEQF